MNLLIVIVNYRTAEMVIDCLRSLDAEVASLPDARVVVTDNASSDGSVEKLRQAVRDHHWERWVYIMPLARNGGFAFGNNAAIREAPGLGATTCGEQSEVKSCGALGSVVGSGLPGRVGQHDLPCGTSRGTPTPTPTPTPTSARDDYVMLLNPDTVVRPGAIASLIEFMQAHSNVGIAGSRLEDPDGTPQRSAFRFHSLLGELENGIRFGPVSRVLSRYVVAPPAPSLDAPCRTDWVAGASMMIRGTVFDDIGLFDEGFFMYYEEVDFCRRARDAGWPCWYVPGSRVVHLVGQSSGVTAATAHQRPRPAYWFESRSRYLRKHHGRLGKLLIDLAWAAGFGLFQLRARAQGKARRDPPGLWRDFVRHNFGRVKRSASLRG